MRFDSLPAIIPISYLPLVRQVCAGIIRTDDVLLILNYIAFAAFAVLRVYGVWDRDWKPLIILVPLALVKPIGTIVSFMWNSLCDRTY